MSKLLLLGNFHGLSTASQYATAFRRLGHDVTTCGPRFTGTDAERWMAALLEMAWPPSHGEAYRYTQDVLHCTVKPDIETYRNETVAASSLREYDAVLSFWAYGETPGIDYERPLPPTALIVGDTHTGHLAKQVGEAEGFDHVFVQHRRSDLQHFDHPSKYWLPPAADPDIWHYGPATEKRYDVLFVGATHPEIHKSRVELLRFLKRELGAHRVHVKHAFGKECARLYNQARVVLNRSLAGDTNMRLVEALCTGASLVTDDVDGLEDTFGIVGYRSPEEALAMVRYRLANPAPDADRARVLANHTYEQRYCQILPILLGEQPVTTYAADVDTAKETTDGLTRRGDSDGARGDTSASGVRRFYPVGGTPNPSRFQALALQPLHRAGDSGDVVPGGAPELAERRHEALGSRTASAWLLPNQVTEGTPDDVRIGFHSAGAPGRADGRRAGDQGGASEGAAQEAAARDRGADEPEAYDGQKVAVIVPAYNNWHLTQQLLDRLAEQKVPRVLIVDDGSTKGSGEGFRWYKSDCVRTDENRGFSAACNLGARQVCSESIPPEYLIFLNNDTVPCYGWAAALVNALEDGASIAGPWLKFPDGRTQSAGMEQRADGTWWNTDPPEVIRASAERYAERLAITGACLAIKRDLFWRLGGFDEGFRMSCSDVDLCLRARALGERIVVTPASVVVHKEGSTRFALAGASESIADEQRRLFARWGIVDERGWQGTLPVEYPPLDSRSLDASGWGQDDLRVGQSLRAVQTGEDTRQTVQDKLGAGNYDDAAALGVGGTALGSADAGRVLGNTRDGDARGSETHRRGVLPSVCWVGPTTSAGGSLAVINENVVRRLAEWGVVTPNQPSQADVMVLHYWPGKEQHVVPVGAKRLVVIQPWEGWDDVPPAWQRTWEHPAFRLLITPSEYSERIFLGAFPGLADRIRVVPNGVDTQVFKPDGPKYLVRPGTEHIVRFLFVGGLIQRKGIDILYDAWRLAFTPDEPVRLVLKAQGHDTFYSNQTLWPPDDLLNVQVMKGDMSTGQLAALYRTCQVLVAPSRAEGFHLPTLEAMASALPVIIPDGGPWNEYVCDDAAIRVVGDLVEAWKHWAKAMRYAYQLSAQRRRAMGSAGNIRARRYDWDVIAKSYLDVLQEVCDAE